jgi:Cu(I)/Ag(I) efflux system membrane protein CusA/SilA
VVYRAASEVGSAVLTAIATTVVSFLPVFTMTGAEGKLFKPLAYTKTFALVASVIVALTIIPAGALLLFPRRISRLAVKRALALAGLAAAAALVWGLGWWKAGAVVGILAAYYLVEDFLPQVVRKGAPWVINGAAVALVGILLTDHWLPLGPDKGFWRNLLFVGVIIGGLQGFYYFIQRAYGAIVRWCIVHKFLFLALPALILLAGIYVWLGPGGAVRLLQWIGGRDWAAGLYLAAPAGIAVSAVYFWARGGLGWASRLVFILLLPAALAVPAFLVWTGRLRDAVPDEVAAFKGVPYDEVADKSLRTYLKWTLANDWDGRGKEFMPPLDEGSFLYMPSLMPHASIGAALEVVAAQDMALRAIPEIDTVVGKIGRADTALDPAPVGMTETVITYKPQFVTDKDGRRVAFRYDEARGEFARDGQGDLIPDADGRPYRQWRPHIKSADDIWQEILKAAQYPGATSAPKLQPIATRIVMLQTGMRAPMGVKIMGPDLETIDRVGLQVERLLKEVPGVEPSAVIADRIVGKPYLEIDIKREAIARYGLSIRQVQDVIETAIGGQLVTRTVEGRERYPVRVRYLRELRDRLETLGTILVPTMEGPQIPLLQLADIRYVRGPEAIKSEDTFLVGYVLFDKKPGYAEVDVVEACERHLKDALAAGDLVLPAGVHYRFSGTYENQLHAQGTLAIILPAALLAIFLILYFQFRSVPVTALLFGTIPVCWAGGFIVIWLYSQPWFLDFDVYGVSMRELFQVHPINLSVAIWVGFLALFGIASDDGVVMATYLDQSFARLRPKTIDEVREATVAGGLRRIRPCLMTTATTVLALLPVLTSTGRGADVMVPMAIPSFGGMAIEVVTMFVVPVVYCALKELRLKTAPAD